jgi:hypothetical protein
MNANKYLHINLLNKISESLEKIQFQTKIEEIKFVPKSVNKAKVFGVLFGVDLKLMSEN